jgi:hypothetical protein
VETSSGRKEVIHVGIADVIVLLSLEAGFDISQLVFQHHEVDVDVVLLPHVLLVPERTVRTATNEISPRFGLSHHVHGDDAGRVAGFQRSVNVKADELCQAEASYENSRQCFVVRS